MTLNPRVNQNNHNTPLKSDANPAFFLDYKKIIADAIRFWWLFLITVSLALITVYIMHRYYRQPVYRATLTLLMEQRGSENPQSSMMEGFGLSTGMRSIDNQIAIMRSWQIMRQTISEVDFHISYIKTGRVKNTELYGNLPFTVHFDSLSPQLLNTSIFITYLNSDEFRLNIDTESGATYNYSKNTPGQSTGRISFSETFRFNEWITTPWIKIRIENHDLSRHEERAHFFQFNNPDMLASQFQSSFTAGRSNDQTSIVRLSLTGHNTAKNIRFLNKLADVFIRSNLDNKNEIATNTIRFIEDQLIIISDSLTTKGNELSNFRTSHQIQSVSAQANMLFTRLEKLAEEKSKMLLTRRYYNYLTTYFSSDTVFAGPLAPAIYPISNGNVTSHINDLMEMNMERQVLDFSHNPYYKELENKMEVARITLLKVIESQVAVIDDEVRRIDQQREETTNELYRLPEMERQLFGIERQFNLNNEVYTFLLRKRSEAQIQKASTTPDHSILETARSAGQISPTIGNDRQKALIAGFLIPIFFLLIRQLLNNRINGSEDVERITRLPIIGHVIHSEKPYSNVVANYPKSVITETFRRIRSRLEYLTGDKEHPIIAVSSSMPGEGKTFCALNLATVFAISGKKTLLVGFDMRKPGLNKLLNLNGKAGLSSYLIGKSELSEVIQASEIENLFILPSGGIPPNPSELIGSEKTHTLFEELKKQYDIILLDTPPMGVVADGYLLARHADTIVFLTRQGFTIRDAFAHTIKQMNDEGIKNVGILINDIEIKKGILNYNYNYGYGYGYGYGYYED
jgi:tyrosine-protein kinase Etk/Wzc